MIRSENPTIAEARKQRNEFQGLESGCANSPARATRAMTRAGNVTPKQMFAILGWHTGPGRADPFADIVCEDDVAERLENMNRFGFHYARPVTITFAD
jgi:hypothetical protein